MSAGAGTRGNLSAGPLVRQLGGCKTNCFTACALYVSKFHGVMGSPPCRGEPVWCVLCGDIVWGYFCNSVEIHLFTVYCKFCLCACMRDFQHRQGPFEADSFSHASCGLDVRAERTIRLADAFMKGKS